MKFSTFFSRQFSASTLLVAAVTVISACGLKNEGDDDTGNAPDAGTCEDCNVQHPAADTTPAPTTSGGVDTGATAVADDKSVSVAVNVTVQNGDTDNSTAAANSDDGSTSNAGGGSGGAGGSGGTAGTGGSNTAGTGGSNAGGTGGSDSCTDCNPDPGPEPTYFPDPYKVWDACDSRGNCDCTIGSHEFYNHDAECQDLRVFDGAASSSSEGAMSAGPTSNFDNGDMVYDYAMDSKNAEGYVLLTLKAKDVTAGLYRFQTLSKRQCSDGPDDANLAWSSVGTPDMMKHMRPEALDQLACTYADDADTTDPKCDGLFYLDVFQNENGNLACRWSPAGNMRNYQW